MKFLAKKKKKKFGNFPVSPALFAIVTVLYCEILFHFWILEGFSFGRFAAVLAFGLGFGGLLSQVVSFIGHKSWGKWVSIALVTLVAAMYLVEYFVSDAYQTFMPLGMLLGGAKGVATDFAGLAIGLIVRDFWRILLILLPVFLFALLAKPTPTSWRLRWIGLVLAIVGYAGGLGIVALADLDTDRLRDSYDFDSAIRCFGVNMGFTLDILNSGETAQEEELPLEELPVYTPLPAPTQPSQEEPEETVAPTEPEYGPNVLPLDYAALAKDSKNTQLRGLHEYVAAQTPSTQNAYTGLFKGKNLILFTAEAFSLEVIDPELTPTLYRLANKGIKFNQYYQPAWGGSTTSGEYSNLMGLVPDNGGMCMKDVLQQTYFLNMGFQLSALGYHSTAYHNHHATFYDRNQTHVRLGYNEFYALSKGLQGVKAVWPESDLEMIDATVADYIDKQPFSIYYMTVSGHCVYSKKENAMTRKNFDKVEHLEHSDTVKGYLASQLELEAALTSLVSQLEAAGIADDTVIVLSTDHYPYGLERSSTWKNTKDHLAELYGVKSYDQFLRDHNALIIWSGSIEDKNIVVDTPVYSLDILPTLSNLFGVSYDSRLLVGRDVFSEAEPLVLWRNRSWVTEKGSYDALKKEFTPAEGMEPADEDYIKRINAIVKGKLDYSEDVQQANYFNHILKALQAAQAPAES